MSYNYFQAKSSVLSPCTFVHGLKTYMCWFVHSINDDEKQHASIENNKTEKMVQKLTDMVEKYSESIRKLEEMMQKIEEMMQEKEKLQNNF